MENENNNMNEEPKEYLNILRQIVSFWEWRMLNAVSHTEADLYFSLLNFANRSGRKEWFNVPNSTLEIWFDKKTLQNARNGLVQKRLIYYEKGKKGQAPRYKIETFWGKNDPYNFPNPYPNSYPYNFPNPYPIHKEKEKEYIYPPYNPPKGTGSRKAPPEKHKYGEYGHVLLTDEEKAKLDTEFPNTDEAIKYLDEYIEMKGYKAKSHYLALRKWVYRALEEDKARGIKCEMRKYGDDERSTPEEWQAMWDSMED